MTITELSIKRPPLIVVIFLFLIILGMFSYRLLKYELLPDITPPIISITTAYPGAPPGEVETSVTKIVEDAVNSVEKIKRVSSLSFESVSLIVLEFTQNADANTSLQEVQRRVNEILPTLPEDAKTPVVSKFAINEMPVLRIGAVSNMPDREFYRFIDETIKPRLSRLEGVGAVTLFGGIQREIRVNVDQGKLKGYGIPILSVLETIKKANLDIPAGKVKDVQGQYSVRISGKLQALQTVQDLVIKDSPDQGPIKIRDVAYVVDGTKEIESISRLNSRSALGILIQKQTGANSVEVCDRVKAELNKIEHEYASNNVAFDIAQDESVFTVDSANNVKFDLMIAILLVGLVMLAFLHSIRNSLIIMVAIPCSLISTFIAMYLLGYTLNLMTLLAFSLVIGILVDDSIVVLENIYRHLEMGKEQRRAAIEGRHEIGFTALSITLVDVVVFLPLALLGGIIGNLVRQFAVVVVVSTSLSLFVSFTITPMLASRYSRRETYNKRTLMGKFAFGFEWFFRNMSQRYTKLLDKALDHKGLVISIATLLLIASISLLPFGFIGQEFLTPTDKGELQMIIELEPGARLEETNAITRKIEKALLERPEVLKVFTNVGSSEEGFIGMFSNNVSELIVTTVPKEERKESIDELGRRYKEIASRFPGVKTRVAPIMIFGTSDVAPIAVSVSGPNLPDVQRTAASIENIVRESPGASEIRQSTTAGKPEVRIDLNREKMAALGLSLDYVGSELRVALNGDNSSKFRDGNTEYDIMVKYDDFDTNNPEQIRNISFVNSKGHKIYLKQFADVIYGTGPNRLERKYRNPSITVLARASGRASGDIGNEIKTKIAKMNLPPGISINYENDLEMQEESFESLGLSFLAAILFVYLILTALYNSFIYPLSVLTTIPLAIIGALLGLALTMQNINIMSLLGMIILVGLVGKNAIILVDRINQNRDTGMDLRKALLESSRTRLRPILMTTLTLVFGVLPIALSTGAANELKTGLAVVLIGGLTSSLFLTLILVPVMYVKFEQFRDVLLKIKDKIIGTAKSEADSDGRVKKDSAAKKTSTVLVILFVVSVCSIQAQPMRVTINDAVEIALAHNRQIRLAQLDRDQSQQKVREAYGYLIPEISLEGNYVRNTKLPVFYLPSEFLGIPGGGNIPFRIGEKNVYEGYIQLQMPVFNAAVYPGIRAAEANQRMNAEQLKTARAKTVADAKKAYLDVLVARRHLQLTEQSITRAGQRLRDVRLLYTQGFAADVDTMTAYLGVETQMPVRLKLQNAIDNAISNLQFIMGVKQNTELTLLDSLSYNKEPVPSDFEEAYARALRDRPEIASMNQAIRGADEQRNIAFASRLPSMNLFGQYKIESQSPDFKFSKYQWPKSSLVGLHLSVPVFSGFRTDARDQQAKIEVQKAKEQLKQLKDYVYLEVKTAHNALVEAMENIDVQEKTVALAERNYSMISSRMRNGLSKLSDLLDAELVLNQAKTNYVNEVYHYLVARAEYDRAVGMVLF